MPRGWRRYCEGEPGNPGRPSRPCGMGLTEGAGRPRGRMRGAPAGRRCRRPPGRPGEVAPDRPPRAAGTGMQTGLCPEIAGLRAAQAVRHETTAIPELVAWGSDWLVTPLAAGSPLAWGNAVPASLFDALPRCMPATTAPPASPAIPRVTPAWWQALCRNGSILGSAITPPGTRGNHRTSPDAHRPRRRPRGGLRRAGRTAPDAPARRRPPRQRARARGRATLIDWGSSRAGPAALDLANLVTADSADVARYPGHGSSSPGGRRPPPRSSWATGGPHFRSPSSTCPGRPRTAHPRSRGRTGPDRTSARPAGGLGSAPHTPEVPQPRAPCQPALPPALTTRPDHPP